MIQRALCVVAGVDRQTLANCPATDRLWATQLGFSLIISFLVVLGISFHATGYIIDNGWLRFLVSAVIALTVFMFDRALYQSDWFSQGVFQAAASANGDTGVAPRSGAQRFLRISIRLGISLVLAWIIAVFLELAIFSDTISDKIKRDYLAANQGVFQKIERYEAQVDAEIAQRRASLASLESLYSEDLARPPAPPPATLTEAIANHDRQIRELGSREQALRTELREIGAQIVKYSEEMSAEELGLKLRAGQSGIRGAGPRYRFAQQQREIQESVRTARERELSELAAERDRLRGQQTRLTAEMSARPDQVRLDARRETLRKQIEAARAELATLEAARMARIGEFRQQILASSEYQPQRNDPLSRMTAYQELKNDPKDGATITLFSWMTKAFVIFLEIAPVLAKMFFAPPSVYAARIQAQVAQGRQRADLEASMQASLADFGKAEPYPPQIIAGEDEREIPMAPRSEAEAPTDLMEVLERELDHAQRRGARGRAAAMSPGGVAELKVGERKAASVRL